MAHAGQARIHAPRRPPTSGSRAGTRLVPARDKRYVTPIRPGRRGPCDCVTHRQRSAAATG
ncbi:MAG: hypothetical protein OXU61_02800 [Gammaproteobacteria bacterium]|nr:hypothetical protein [Gammaproteobacteria bacterium]